MTSIWHNGCCYWYECDNDKNDRNVSGLPEEREERDILPLPEVWSAVHARRSTPSPRGSWLQPASTAPDRRRRTLSAVSTYSDRQNNSQTIVTSYAYLVLTLYRPINHLYNGLCTRTDSPAREPSWPAWLSYGQRGKPMLARGRSRECENIMPSMQVILCIAYETRLEIWRFSA